MKQVFQSLDSGETQVLDVPAPGARPGHLLIHTTASVVSAGTERMLMEFGSANLLQKARQQPERVREVLDKVRTDGFEATVAAVRSKLAQPIPLGYSSAGVVLDVGAGVAGFARGDRVISNGPHAEIASIPVNLCAKIPSAEIIDEHAAFTVVGAIALQGIRLLQPTLGERFVVTGLGLIGLMAVQLLRAHGCAVLGIDPDTSRCELAQKLGASTVDLSAGQDVLQAAQAFSRGRGVDGVVITAATKSSEPMAQAAQMCRKRGRIVLVGVTGLELSRDLFYEKELTFQVSCSYGPGRYDAQYEQAGQDYPIGFVRWTEGRNFEAVLDMLADGRLDVGPLITHRIPVADATRAYSLLADEPALGIVLQYPQPDGADSSATAKVLTHARVQQPTKEQPVRVGVIGAGQFATSTLLPILENLKVPLEMISSSGGSSAGVAAKRFGFARSTSDAMAVIEDPEVTVVFITTRHDSHASLAAAALRAGKAVYVEKPLAINHEGLAEVRQAWDEATEAGRNPRLTVGFNRRSAPHIIRMKELLQQVDGPKSMIMIVNAGALPADHWLHDPEVGGGRLIGEGCHFIDLLAHLADAHIQSIDAVRLGDGKSAGDSFSVVIRFSDGSTGFIHYQTNGHRREPKERLTLSTGGRTLTLNNFRSLSGHGWRGFRRTFSPRQNKGHAAHIVTFLRSGTEGPFGHHEHDNAIWHEVARYTLLASLALAIDAEHTNVQ